MQDMPFLIRLVLGAELRQYFYDACEDYACKDFSRGGKECNTTPIVAVP